MKVYLDQNIISDLYDGVISIENDISNYEWIYSHEHFNEIKRGNKSEFLEVLEELEAKLIRIEHDVNFQQTGKVFFEDYSSPKERYEDYLENNSNTSIDKSLWTDLIINTAGADNFESIENWPERLEKQIFDLIPKDSHLKSELKEILSALKPLLNDSFTEFLGDVDDLATQREALGTTHITQFEDSDNSIEEIWELIKDTNVETTPEQYFGFESKDGETISEYLGIVACHNLLNRLGFRPDKGQNKERAIHGILSDGSHIGYGAYCNQLISADSRFCAKAKAIYKFRKIGTVVTKVDTN